ncbi:MAG TPA: hypothetical protein VJ885_15650 [Thermoanaerobaculia bacterium]|nr:hypothetical protein [Thermoanaerobaculia bacterium]
MTNLATDLQTSPELREIAISELEKMRAEADERVRQLNEDTRKVGLGQLQREAFRRARRIRHALRWVRAQAEGQQRFAFRVAPKYSLVCFLVLFGQNLWKAFTNPALGTSGLGIAALTSIAISLPVGYVLALLDWRTGQRACADLLEPVLESEELKRPN